VAPQAGADPHAAIKTAVALLVREQLAPDLARADVLGDVPPGDALRAMETIAGGLIQGVWPADHGAGFLSGLGIDIARLDGDR
jgi:hypothetical protein